MFNRFVLCVYWIWGFSFIIYCEYLVINNVVFILSGVLLKKYRVNKKFK